MKVIGMADSGHRTKYICEVSHEEIEKFMGSYYGNMSPLRCGDEIDLGKGYDFQRDTKDALKKTQEFIEANARVIDAIFNGVKVLGCETKGESGE